METSIENEPEETVYPSLAKRFQASMIDVVVIIVMMIVLSSIFSSFSEVPDLVRIAAFIFIWFGYEPLFTIVACTLGQKIAGIRVRKFDDVQKKINAVQAYLRFTVKYFLGIISFFCIHSNRERRAIHDMVSGTVVVEHKD